MYVCMYVCDGASALTPSDVRFVLVPRRALRPQPAAEDMAASSAAAAMAASAAAAASEDEFRQDGPVAQRIAAYMPYYKFKGM